MPFRRVDALVADFHRRTHRTFYVKVDAVYPNLQLAFVAAEAFVFFELMLRYNISVDQFLLETPPEKNTQRRQLDALLDGMSDTGIRIVSATAKEIAEVETEGR